MRFLVKNFGCRASQADGAAIEAGLSAKGLASTAEMADAELVVLNTCTVTATADDEVRQVVRRIHREQPGANAGTSPQGRIVRSRCFPWVPSCPRSRGDCDNPKLPIEPLSHTREPTVRLTTVRAGIYHFGYSQASAGMVVGYFRCPVFAGGATLVTCSQRSTGASRAEIAIHYCRSPNMMSISVVFPVLAACEWLSGR